MLGCYPERASRHREFRRQVMATSERVLAADETGPQTTEVTLSGTDPVPPAVSSAIGLCGLSVELTQPNGGGYKIVVK
jgi:hypothetical protein